MSNCPEVNAQPGDLNATPLAVCLSVCERLGEGYVMDACSSGERHAAASRTQWLIRCPDGGCVEVQPGDREWVCRALAWPSVERVGLRRGFHQVLEVRVSPQRGVDALVGDLRRRLFVPYAKALSEARSTARQYRAAWQTLDEQLGQVGLNLREAQVVGRTVQLQRPYAPLDAGGVQLPSVSATVVGMRDLTPVVGVDVRNLSVQEAAELHRFLDGLMARRQQGQLRLCA